MRLGGGGGLENPALHPDPGRPQRETSVTLHQLHHVQLDGLCFGDEVESSGLFAFFFFLPALFAFGYL
jgi:hypothetical protein